MQKFRDNKKRKTVIFFFFLVVGIGIYFLRGSYAKYEVVDSFTLIEGQVPSFAKHIEGNIIENLPTIASIDENFCGDNGVVQVSHDGVTGTTNDTEFQKKEYRYCGLDPNNYVTFNGEASGWRMIGLVNTPEGQRIKLVKTNFLESKNIDVFVFDSKDRGIGSSNSVNGSNDWTDSQLMMLLNPGYEMPQSDSNGNIIYEEGASHYWNSMMGNCYYGLNDIKEVCDFTSSGIMENAKDMIDRVTWNLGGSKNSDITASDMYAYERGNNVYNSNPTLWTGEIGLMYPSDYGYATGGDSLMDRNTCLAKSLYHFSEDDCAKNNWINQMINYNTHLLTPLLSSTMNFHLRGDGYVSWGSYVNTAYKVYPTLFLTSNVQIASGNGTVEEPYILKV